MQLIVFENHFMPRVMEIRFPEGFAVSSKEDLQNLKSQWMQNIALWHSPYVCLFDMTDFSVEEGLYSEFFKLVEFFKKFFMKEFIPYAPTPRFLGEVPFKILPSYEEAIGLTRLAPKGPALSRNLSDLRSKIQIENDFSNHVIEISFLEETIFTTKEDIEILSSKLKNILMMWHTPYSVMFNCVNCLFEEEAQGAFAKLEKFLLSFFCKKIIGYAPKGLKVSYPFEVVRSRHLAAGQLEHSGLQPGAVANCSSAKGSSSKE